MIVSGCGGGSSSSGSSSGISKLAASQSCMNTSCHGLTAAPVTGQLIADEWKASTHNTKNAASCSDCHEPASGHPNLCNKCHGGGGYGVTVNPDLSGKCGKCHGPAFPDNVMMALAPQHYGYSSARALPATQRAQYVSGQYVGRCRACHNPHNNTLTQQHRDYALSKHGDATGVAWASRDFKQNAGCIRCHTTTGYKAFVTSDFTVPTAGFGAGDPTREVLACDGCHASYDFKNSIRQPPAFTAAYNGFAGTPAVFPDNGETNLCIPCHTGRDSGQSVNAITDFSNAKFVSSHGLAVAGLMYMQAGFINFTSMNATIGTSTYAKSLMPDSASTPGGITGGTASTHRKFGTTLINGDNHSPTFFQPGIFDQNGPCVTCHLNAYGVSKRPGSGHSLKIDANAYKQVCVNCHTSENGVTMTATTFRALFIDPNSEAYQTALRLVQTLLLNKYNISYDKDTDPYFFDESLPLVNGQKQPVTDWTRGGTVNGRKLMGACFNLHLLSREPAAFAHARSYSRRLVYDSIDFLDDGIMNLSSGTTALNSGLTLDNGKLAFVKDTKAYNTSGSAITTIYGTTSEAMLYLINWSRSTGLWITPERP